MRRQLLAAVLAALLFAPAGEAWTWPAAGSVLQPFLFEGNGPRTNISVVGNLGPYDGCDSGVSGALFGHLATDHTGALYLARMSCRRPVVAISRDEGATWDEHAIGPPGWNGYGETAVAVDEDGVVYGLWISNDRLPYLVFQRGSD